MKKPFLNLLLMSCLMSSVQVKASNGDIEGFAGLVLGGAAAVAATMVVGVASGAAAIQAKRKWGSLTVGVPAQAFKVLYTKANKELLEAAKDKNKTVIREMLRRLNKDTFDTTNYAQIKNILNEFGRLEENRKKASFRYALLQRGRHKEVFGVTVIQPETPKIRKAGRILAAATVALEEFEKKYPQFEDKWNSLRSLYGAVDAIYNKKGQYQRFIGLRKMTENEFIAIKEKLDKQLGISDQ